MSKIDKWKKDRDKDNRGNPKGVKKDNHRGKKHPAISKLTPPSTLPKSTRVTDLRVDEDLSLSIFDDLEPDQDFMINPSGAEEGQVYTATIDPISGKQVVAATNPDIIAYTTDGSAPTSSPAPTVVGGPRFFSVKWTGVANADLVTYEVHVSDTTGFTPDGTTLAGETPGSLAFVKKLPDGTDFLYDTDYFFKLVAKDEDGSAAASTESAATQLDPNASDDILAGSITAEHFEAVMSMASAMLAGTWGGTNVQTGFGVKDDGAGNPELDASFVGIRAYDGSGGTDPVFRVDASDGTVQVKGRIYFGSNFGSKLTRNDMVQIAEQPGGSWMEATLEQSDSAVDIDVSTVDVVWPATPAPGNLLLMVVTNWNAGGNATHTVSGYTSVKSNVFGGVSNARQQIFKRVATGDGNDDVTVTLSASVDAVLVQFFEFSGVQDVEDATSATDTASDGSSPAESGTTGSATTQDGLAFGVVGIYGNYALKSGVNPSFDGSPPSGYTQIGDDAVIGNPVGSPITLSGDKLGSRVWMKRTGSAESLSVSSAVVDVDAWRGTIVSFKAKANAVEAADAETARLYTADVSGDSVFHVVDEDGDKNSVALGPLGAKVVIARGKQSVTGDGTASKDKTFAHGLGVTPTSITAITASTSHYCVVNQGSTDATNITIRVVHRDGSNWSSTFDFYWIALT